MSEKSEKDYDCTRVFEEELRPLVDRMIAVCREHRIPMFVLLQVASKGYDVTCMTASTGRCGRELCPRTTAAMYLNTPEANVVFGSVVVPPEESSGESN